MSNSETSNVTVLANLTEEIDDLRYKIRQIQRRRTGIIIALVSAALIAGLILRIAPLEPVALFAGIAIAVLLFVVIYWLARRGAQQKVAQLAQQLAAREQLIADYMRRTASSPPIAAEARVQCPSCHTGLSPDDVALGACPQCGSKFETTCPKCGTPVADSARLCPSCFLVFERSVDSGVS